MTLTVALQIVQITIATGILLVNIIMLIFNYKEKQNGSNQKTDQL